MDPDDNQLQGMDLVQRGPNDSKIENEFEWDERKNVHTGLELSTLVENNPSHGKFFGQVKSTCGFYS